MKTLFDAQLGLEAEDVPDPSKIDYVNLSIGAPSNDLMPVALTEKALQSSLKQREGYTTYLQYGPLCGDGDFLKYLAAWLSKEYSSSCAQEVQVEPGNLILTSGASQSLANLIGQLTDPSATTILFEDPTYFLARGLFLDHSHAYRFEPVQQDEHGLDIAMLERILEAKSDSRPFDIAQDRFPFMLYCVPTFNNPTSRVLSAERRRKLVKLAYKYNVLVVCDDVYDVLHFGQSGVLSPTIASMDNGAGRVISNGSFSKLFGPGVRCGWMEIRGRQLHERVKSAGVFASGGATNHFTSTFLLLPCLKYGWMEDHMRDLRQKLGARKDALLAALKQHMPQSVTWTVPDG